MTDLVRAGPDATQRAKLPGLAAPRTNNAALDRWIQLVTERLEVREGNRGNPWERTATVRDLRRLGLGATTFNTANDITGGVLVQEPGGDVRLAKLKDLAARLQMVTEGSGQSSTPAAPPAAGTPAPAPVDTGAAADTASIVEAGIRRVQSMVQSSIGALSARIDTIDTAVRRLVSNRIVSFQQLFSVDAGITTLKVGGGEVTTTYIDKPDFAMGAMDAPVAAMEVIQVAMLMVPTRAPRPPVAPPPLDPLAPPPPPPPPPPFNHAMTVTGHCTVIGDMTAGEAEIELHRDGMAFSKARVTFTPGSRQTHLVVGVDAAPTDGIRAYTLHVKGTGVSFKYTEPALTVTGGFIRV